MDKVKVRVRLCLKDIYRYMAIGHTVDIDGIYKWSATLKSITVVYSNRERHVFKTKDEAERRDAIKIINKYISEVH